MLLLELVTSGISSSDFKTTAYKSPTVTHGCPNKVKLKNEKRHIPSASTALLLGGILGLLQTIFLIFLAKPILSFMGVKSVSIIFLIVAGTWISIYTVDAS